MARFDVYTRLATGLFVDVQADRFQYLRRLLLVPLLPVETGPPPIRDINPEFVLNGRSYLFMAQYIAAVPRTDFHDPVDNLDRYWDEITRALDTLLTGL